MAQRELDWGVSENFVSPTWTVGVGLLILTKLTDLITTILGLVVVDGLVEKNPIGAWIYGEIGIAGLVLSSVAGVLLVIVVVEWAGNWLVTLDDCSVQPRHLYLLSYFPLILVYGFATVHNSVLLLQKIG